MNTYAYPVQVYMRTKRSYVLIPASAHAHRIMLNPGNVQVTLILGWVYSMCTSALGVDTSYKFSSHSDIVFRATTAHGLWIVMMLVTTI